MTANKLRHIIGAFSTVIVVAISAVGIIGSVAEQTPWQFVERKFLHAFLSTSDVEVQAKQASENNQTVSTELAPAAYSKKDETFSPEPPVRGGDIQTITTMGPDQVERKYIVHVGQDYNAEAPTSAPIMFSFHGWNQPAEHYVGFSKFETTPAWQQAIVIYPEGLDGAWESAPYATGRPGKDLEFVQQIIEEIDKDYLIDRQRIYATGFSNGGGMATVLACHMPDTFAAIVSIAGAYYQPVNFGCQSKPIPSLVIHAVNDEIVRYEGGPRNGGQLIPAYEVSKQYALRNGCAMTPPVEVGLPNGQRLDFERCSAPTQHLKILEGGHIWPEEPDIAREIWNFLTAQARA
jgi:hypothetical protein